MTPTITNYPVFEADQVLSQKHLNKLISYLEEQDRMSRVGLLGMGIVCGLEITRPNATSLVINCGTAITSLGYQIPFETTRFTEYKETIISKNFLSPDLDKHPYLESVYEYAQLYEPFEVCLELVAAGAEDVNNEHKPLTKSILEDKVVMLLIEAPLIDEKNCVAIDCADKGKRLEFRIRPLLLEREALEDSQIPLNTCQDIYLKPIALPRYNVPKSNLIIGDQVLDAFSSQINSSKQKIQGPFKTMHDLFENSLGSLTGFSGLAAMSDKITKVHDQFKTDLHLQYVWDWLQDMADTYDEIVRFNKCNPGICCPDNGEFPFHVLLGLAEFETKDISPVNDLYRFRTPFTKTGTLIEEEQQKRKELTQLFERLIHISGSFLIDSGDVLKKGIKITPSLFGNTPLSDRAIPYYYEKVKSLHNKWSAERTLMNQEDEILGYHSDRYNSTDAHVKNPLLFAQEPYNFYRIEGHIGQNYTRALTEVIAQKQKFRLPFEVIALNAVDFTGKNIDIAQQKSVWDDMELDYDLAKEKVYNITEYVISWIKENKVKIQAEYTAMTDQAIQGLEDILIESRTLLVDDLKDFLPVYEQFYEVFEQLNTLFLSHRFCISLFPDLAEKSIIEDFVDHLDEINILFLEDPFTIIHDEANRRWEAQFKETFLSNFLEKHSGIAHAAGVPVGGTFIMIYKDNNVFKTSIPKLDTSLLLGRINSYMGLFKFDEAQKKKIFEGNVVRKRAEKKRKPVITPQPDDPCKKTAESMKEEVLFAAKKNITDLPQSTQDFMLTNFANAFDFRSPIFFPAEVPGNIPVVPVSNIPERQVIADFYIPYICCSKGNNINIVLPPAETSETGLVDFDENDFNAQDFFTSPE